MWVAAFHVKLSARPVHREALHCFPCGECLVISMLVGAAFHVKRESGCYVGKRGDFY